jgi:hypothetical protein
MYSREYILYENFCEQRVFFYTRFSLANTIDVVKDDEDDYYASRERKGTNKGVKHLVRYTVYIKSKLVDEKEKQPREEVAHKGNRKECPN